MTGTVKGFVTPKPHRNIVNPLPKDPVPVKKRVASTMLSRNDNAKRRLFEPSASSPTSKAKLTTANAKLLENEKVHEVSVSAPPKKKIKDMTREERNAYNRQKYAERKEKLGNEMSAKKAESNKRSRENLKQNDPVAFAKSNTEAVKKSQRKSKEKDPVAFSKSHNEAQKKYETVSKEKDPVAFAKSHNEAQKKYETLSKEKDPVAFVKSHNEADKKYKTVFKENDPVTFAKSNTEAVKKSQSKSKENGPVAFSKSHNEAQKKYETKRKESAEKRSKLFRDSVRYGRIYPCVSCHRLLYSTGVSEYDQKFRAEMDSKFPEILEKAIGSMESVEKFVLRHEDTSFKLFICGTCKSHISKDKIPPMSHMNKLGLVMSQTNNLGLPDLVPELRLTELENAMIALNLVFQKIVRLPGGGRWPALKDRTVNIPVHEADVVKTLESLPRTPSLAGIIPVNLKRKKSYKNNHIVQYVSVPKILNALKLLKSLGNRFYVELPITETFENDCRENDVEGFQFLFPDEDQNENEDDETEAPFIGPITLGEFHQQQQMEYEKNDPARKFQFDFNSSTCYSDNYPEINFREEDPGRLTIAPGEGKIPSNILKCDDWDLKTFPALLPDGKNSLHTDRDVKLTEQNYFGQRLLNQDQRFATNPAFVFAAVAYIEKKQMESRAGELNLFSNYHK